MPSLVHLPCPLGAPLTFVTGVGGRSRSAHPWAMGGRLVCVLKIIIEANQVWRGKSRVDLGNCPGNGFFKEILG